MSHQNSNNNNNSMLNTGNTHYKSPDAIADDSIGPYDVLCGRHKLAFNNVGNRRMRVTISLALHRYLAQKDRQGKSLIIKSVVHEITNNGGRFLKWSKVSLCFVEIDDKKAHQKCSHAFRDMVTARGLSTSFNSSSGNNSDKFNSSSGNNSDKFNSSSGSNSDNTFIPDAAKNAKTTCTPIFEYKSAQQEKDAQNTGAPSHQELAIPPTAAAAKIDTFVNIFDDDSLEDADSLLLPDPSMATAIRLSAEATADDPQTFQEERCSGRVPSSDDSMSSSSDSSSDIWFEFKKSIEDDEADFFEQDAEDERILFSILFEQEIKGDVNDDYDLDGHDGHDMPLSKKSMDR